MMMHLRRYCRSARADDLAYILFTSGSTGQPKGVMLSHFNAFTFLDWCQRTLGPWNDDDRFASHAPFHFDLSVFDVFAACQAASTLVLIGENLGKDPVRLGAFITERRLSIWYSAPSILALLAERGKLERPGFRAPRLGAFCRRSLSPRRARAIAKPMASCGHVEPVRADRDERLHRLSDSRDDTRRPNRAIPDRHGLPPLTRRVVDEHGRDVTPGALGELVISGPGVMRGYFGQPELTAAVFLVDDDGSRWYRTGDLVTDSGDGCFQFHGRSDRMIKKRGYRIELGEIESALYRHDGVDRAGVVAQADETGVSIAAFVCAQAEPEAVDHRDETALHALSAPLHDPRHDHLSRHLPATSTDKLDYQRLRSLASNKDHAREATHHAGNAADLARRQKGD